MDLADALCSVSINILKFLNKSDQKSPGLATVSNSGNVLVIQLATVDNADGSLIWLYLLNDFDTRN